ncbi:MAG: type II toxin-antitoxin system RelE/ParE family toxin [Vicinamibacterales bacterium]
MAYRVEIARNAEVELEELYLWIVARAPHQGAKWFNGLERAVVSLDQLPKRCPLTPESINPDQPHLYRVCFTVNDTAEAVRVVHIRHRARTAPVPDELKGD